MMKLFAALFVVAVFSNCALAGNRNGGGVNGINGGSSVFGAQKKVNMQCDVQNYQDISTDWIDLRESHGNECLKKVKAQIQMEIDASYIYLGMGAHFAQDIVNRPGFAEFFFKSAKEEREHGSKLIEYLSMRGHLTNGVTNLIQTPSVVTEYEGHDAVTVLAGVSGAKGHLTWRDAIDALKEALMLEISVTKSIRALIGACEAAPNYYHLVDWLTGVYLEEQLHGQRELAGKITTLGKMMRNHGALGEFLFDKQNM